MQLVLSSSRFSCWPLAASCHMCAELPVLWSVYLSTSQCSVCMGINSITVINVRLFLPPL
jgi:hypothetical protein